MILAFKNGPHPHAAQPLPKPAACAMSSRVTVPLPMPRVSVSAAPLDSWHMFEQSGRLFVPSRRASSWYTNAASLLARPLV